MEIPVWPAARIPPATFAPSPGAIGITIPLTTPVEGEDPADAAWRARILATRRDRIVLDLAGLARAVVERELWIPLGYAQLSDFARERLGRSSRWVRDLAALEAALGKLPQLAPALCGEEGPAIGRTAALWIGRTASAESVGEWIELARRCTARALREAVRAARAAGSRFPVDAKTAAEQTPGFDAEAEDFAERVTLRLAVPPSLRVAFEEALDLHRCVSGGEAPVESFVDALLGEAASRGEMPEPLPRAGTSPDTPPPTGSDDNTPSPADRSGEACATDASATGSSGETSATSPSNEASVTGASSADSAAECSRARPRSARSDAPPNSASRDADPTLRRLDAEEVQSRLQALDTIERELGRILASIGARRAWGEIGASGAWEFSQDELGWSRSTAAGRAWLARTLSKLPALRCAYETGRIGFEKTLLVRRSLGDGEVEPWIERAWVGLATLATVKRMRDERRLVLRRQVGDVVLRGETPGKGGRGTEGRALPPATDAEWFASLLRVPGMARERVARLGRQALAESVAPLETDVLLRLNLPEELSLAFLATLEQRREVLEAALGPNREGVTALGEKAPAVPGSFDARGPAVRLFSMPGEPVPRWVGLLSLLEDYVETHDDPRNCPRREWDATYGKAGYRCMAPGCTARADLHNHHVQYRADLGSDEPWNLVALCRFHHLQGEHGRFARIRGRAPIDLVCRLGTKEFGRWYRNEKEIPAPTR